MALQTSFAVLLLLLAHTSASSVKLLVYETNPGHVRGSKQLAVDALVNNAKRAGLDATVFGAGTQFRGFGSKYAAATPLLRALPSDTLVVISDARDVLVNFGAGSGDLQMALSEGFEEIVSESPGAVVFSAESSCCVGAMTYFKPGDLFAEDGTRTGRACHSGKPGCTWNGDDKRAPWEGFMSSLAGLRTASAPRDVYLNAGLMAGRATDLLRLFEMMSIDDEEDDQAVLSDLLYRAPHMIRLDYQQSLFGNNRWPQGLENGGCVFGLDHASRSLVHAETGTTPPFVHSPGKFWECHDRLADALQQWHPTHERRMLNETNYRPSNAATSLEVKLTSTATTLAFASLITVVQFF